MRIVYLAIAAIAVGVATFSGEGSNGSDQQQSVLAALMRDRAKAMPDRLQVGDPIEPPSFVSSR